MHSKWVFKHFYTWPGRRIRGLAAIWILGLLIGIALCGFGAYDHDAMLSAVISASPAPLSLLLVCFLPIALIAVALTTPFFQLSYFVVFLSAVSHGFCGMLIYIAQGSASWLLRPLLLLSASGTSALIWWLLLNGITQSRLHRSIRLAVAFACVIYIVDLFLVSPFVGDLAKYL